MDRCDHCGSYREVAYTLVAHTESDAEGRIELTFCSSDCLRVWTGSPSVLTASPQAEELHAARLQGGGRAAETR